jgi:hypothetical protein
MVLGKVNSKKPDRRDDIDGQDSNNGYDNREYGAFFK